LQNFILAQLVGGASFEYNMAKKSYPHSHQPQGYSFPISLNRVLPVGEKKSYSLLTED
jgi:hypothetical protein